MKLEIAEIFYSIQGESSYAGLPCSFIRLAGCNLRCAYCDTRYAYINGQELTIEDISQELVNLECPLVEITGGEPLLQKNTPKLIDSLLASGYTVLVETNGSLDIETIPEAAVIIMDIKCPSSGEVDSFFEANIQKLRANDEVKFVIKDQEDYFFAKNIYLQEFGTKKNKVHFSPVFGVLEPSILAGWILADRLAVYLHLQLHKYIWAPETKGV